MRYFIALFLLSISTFSSGQTELLDAKKIWARDSIRLGTNWIRSISKDTALLTVTDRDIPSAKAVKDFVLNRWNNGLVHWDNVTGKPSLLISGNNLADVSNVATARTNLSVYSISNVDALLSGKLSATITSPAIGNLIRYNGSSWVNWAPNYLSFSDSLSGGYTSWLLTKKKIDSLGFRANDFRVHIKDFGADSTGVLNSTVPILNAIAEAKLRGAALVIDPGTYWISQALPIDDYHEEIIGYNSTIRLTGNTRLFSISNCDNLSIKGVRLVGNKQPLQTGVYATGSNQMDIDIRFDSLFQAVYIDQTQASTPPYEQNNMVRVIGGRSVYGVFLNSSAEYVTVHNSIMHDIDSIGVWIRGGNNGVVGTTIHGANIGIYVQGTFAPNSDHGRIVGNVINHYEKCGVLLEYLRFSHIVSGNDIWAAGSGNLYGTGKSFGIYIKKSQGATITSNTIASNPVSIGLDSSDFNNISSNTFLNFLSLTEANIKEYGTKNSYNNTITTNNFVAVSGSKVDSVVMLSGSSIGGTSYVGRQTIHNQFGGTTPSNYLNIRGATANNLNYPGLQLTGGTLATTYPNLRLVNGGLGASVRSGTSAGFPGISEIRMDASEGFVVANNTTGNPDIKFRVELGGRLRAFNVETGSINDQLLTINTDTLRKIPTSLLVVKSDTAAYLDKVTFDRALRNGSTSGRSFTSGAATLLGTRNNTAGNVNLNISSTAGYGFRINTSNELVLDAFNGSTWAEAHKWALGGASFNYSRFYGTSMVLNKDSVPTTTTNVLGLTIDSITGRIQKINLRTNPVYGTKLIGNSSAPSVTLGANITGSVAVTGTDMSGTITVTVTGISSLATNNELFTLTYNSAYSSTPHVVWSPSSANAAALLQAAGGLYLKNSGTSSFQIATVNSYSTPASATYSFTYHVIQ